VVLFRDLRIRLMNEVPMGKKTRNSIISNPCLPLKGNY
jgi:hypothetical protein